MVASAVSVAATQNGRMVLELPPDVHPATSIRSALLQSSLVAVERLGMTQRYFDALDPESATTIRNLVVGQWYPMSLGVAHYGAIDSLGLSSAQAKANGRLVAEKVQVGFASTIFRGIGTAITPLDALKRSRAFLDRLMQGGGVCVEQRGPKDARVSIIKVPIGRFDYVRNGWAGMFEATLGLLTYRTLVRVVPTHGGDDVVIDVAWV